MTVPHQSFDNVRLLVGNLHMHGGLVSAGRIELVGLAGSAILVGCLNRGLSRLGGVFGSQIRSEMLLAMRILRASRMTSWYICSRSSPDIAKSLICVTQLQKTDGPSSTPQPVPARLRRNCRCHWMRGWMRTRRSDGGPAVRNDVRHEWRCPAHR